MTGQGILPAAIALNRFGLGARPGDVVAGDPRRFVADQLDRYEPKTAAFAALPDAGRLVQRYRRDRRAERQSLRAAAGNTPDGAKAMLQPIRQDFRDDAQALYRAAVEARTDAALTTQAPFVERMVHFWANHFCISADNAQLAAFAGAFERDAIRPHVLGRFEDMARAAERHPAMLLYLNQANSVGPASPAATRNPDRRRGLNENLGREIMELHTLGVRSGYSQADVTEFARALTGWTVDGLSAGGLEGGDPDRFAFRPQFHEPGPRTLLGKRYDQAGEAQASAMLADLCRAPATARHVATKLARHFAGDDPPPALVDRLAKSFEASGGDLPAVYRTLIASPEPWSAAPLKFKTPWEWTVSTLRGLGRTRAAPLQVAALQTQLGQTVWKPGAPAGWDDGAASWAAPDALMRRVEMAQRLAATIGDRIDARGLGPRLIPASLSPATSEQVTRSESPAGALALLLVSPDFLRR